MADQNHRTLVGRDGTLGWIDLDEQPANGQEALVRLENGTAVRVPADLLVKQVDGSFFLPMSQKQFLSFDTPDVQQGRESIVVVPVVVENVEVSKRQVTSGRVLIAKRVHEREEVIDVPIIHQEVQVERVSVDRIIKDPPKVRYEGDTMIIPVVEEVLVVEKQLRLKEEVRVTMFQREVREPAQVTLRSEEVDVHRGEQGEPEEKEL